MTSNFTLANDSEMQSAIQGLFALAGISLSKGDITGADMQQVLQKLKGQLGQSTTSPNVNLSSMDSFSNMAAFLGGGTLGASSMGSQNILIVGELGIVTYQLKVALSKKGASVTIVKGVDEAITEYQRRDYSGVLIDIFMPTEREGLLVLSEIRNMAVDKRLQTNIVVLATPVKEKSKDLKELCLQKGAQYFLPKSEGWHQRVIDFFLTGTMGADD